MKTGKQSKVTIQLYKGGTAHAFFTSRTDPAIGLAGARAKEISKRQFVFGPHEIRRTSNLFYGQSKLVSTDHKS
jgi:hypothetical protein